MASVEQDSVSMLLRQMVVNGSAAQCVTAGFTPIVRVWKKTVGVLLALLVKMSLLRHN